ncbi:Atu1372/SO_1960 family protein [Hymenobacter sp. IS2118]|uniref:Atu1372/SO_1960 family protein n=1 Tax=Hymenobacter sp. IS2118 TaxID=1505605 RepID=UPI000B07F3E8|nr:Atu1372/SO_1960 family protein [Hymenobacter sp. IS2118]
MSEEMAVTEEQEQVGDRLVALMNSRNLTAYQFAKTLGYEGPQKLYKLLQNKSKPGYETLMDVLNHYPTLRAEWLMRGLGSMFGEGDAPAAGAAATTPGLADTKRPGGKKLVLPEPPAPGGAYESVRVLGGVAYVAVQFPFAAGKPAFQGRIGAELTTAQGREAARLCALNVLAQVEKYVGLGQVLGLNRIEAQLVTAEGWDKFPTVLDGASELFLEALGPEVGRHARALGGVERLPMNLPISLTASFTLRPVH